MIQRGICIRVRSECFKTVVLKCQEFCSATSKEKILRTKGVTNDGFLVLIQLYTALQNKCGILHKIAQTRSFTV